MRLFTHSTADVKVMHHIKGPHRDNQWPSARLDNVSIASAATKYEASDAVGNQSGNSIGDFYSINEQIYSLGNGAPLQFTLISTGARDRVLLKISDHSENVRTA